MNGMDIGIHGLKKKELEKKQEKDEITWHWFYEISKKTDSGAYVRIMKCEVK